MRARRRFNCIPILLIAALLASGLSFSRPPSAFAASDTPFALARAEQMSLASSSEISKIYNQILLKQIGYTDAVT
ncbi:MAG: hypothetical protein LBL63_01100, partial [Clostridiales Family XIII bacterium]|nr:hypothetical protein [Clostridiales Family XIII bacterium]